MCRLSPKVNRESKDAQFTFDLSKKQLFKRNDQNYIDQVGVEQLNTLQHTSILNIHLSKGYVVEPHYHQDADELIYCIRGGVTISMMNPSTKELHHYPIKANQVVNVPQGWWHYIESDANQTQILGVFSAPTPKVILASDILNGTPPEIMAKTYCIDEKKWEEAIKPMPKSVFIGPPRKCQEEPHKDHHHKREIPRPREEQWNPYSYKW